MKNKRNIFIFRCLTFISLIFLLKNGIYAKSEYKDGINSFPESYQVYLRQIVSSHPNWKFKAVYTNLDWQNVVDNESVDRKSLVPAGFSSEWKLNDTNIEPGWVNASYSAVGYALDPRNFLNEEKIFQFKVNTSDNNDNVNVVKKVLYGTPMGDTYYGMRYKNNGKWNLLDGNSGSLTYSDIINTSGKLNNVSSVHLASRIRQENAGDIINNNCINGSYPGYEGLYNFFNIGANNAGGRPIVVNALLRARSEGWTHPKSSIDGAAKKIYNDYIKWGQDTVYFEKWDVNDKTGGQKLFWMQYMTNILAPSNESSRIYSAYKSCNMLNCNFEFNIPVYNNMPPTPVRVEEEAKFQDDHTKVYLDDTSDIGVTDTFVIRAEPNSTSATIATIVENLEGKENRTILTRIKKGINVQWDKVKLKDGREGYVFSSYVHEFQNYIKVTQIKLNKQELYIKSGQKEKLSATVIPDNAKFKDVIYTTNNSNVLSVDENGNVIGRNLGDATVFAMSDDNLSIIDTCYVAVSYTDSFDLGIGNSINLKKAEYGDCKIYTNNSQVLNVSSNGTVEGKRFGDATVFIEDKNGNKLAIYYVNVGYTGGYSPVKIGDTFKIDKKGTKYYTNNSNVLNVDAAGNVTGKYIGDATVFVENASGTIIAMYYVNVGYTGGYSPVKVGETFKIDKKGTKYYTNNSNVLSVDAAGNVTGKYIGDATVFVENTSGTIIAVYYVNVGYTQNKEVYFQDVLKFSDFIGTENKYHITTNNSKLLSINNNDKTIRVNAVKGDCTLFILDSLGNIKSMIYVNVKEYPKVNRIVLNQEEFNIKVGEKDKLISTVLPENTKYKNVTYKSNAEDLFSIDESGNICAKFVGSSSISIISEDKTFKDIKCKVNVLYNASIETDKLTSKSVWDYFDKNDSKYKDVVLSINNENVATISQDGKITPKNIGDATIFVKDKTGNILSMIYVNVIDYVKVEEIKVESNNIQMKVGDNTEVNYTILPQNAKYKDISLKSSNDNIYINYNNTITAQFVGETILTLISNDPSKKVYYQIRVNIEYTDTKKLDLGNEYDVYNLFDFSKISEQKDLKFESNNDSIFKINESSKLVTLGKRRCYIIC